MKLPYKIALINLAAVIIPTLLMSFQNDFIGDTAFFFYGIFGMSAGIINLLLALILLIAGNKKPGLLPGILLSGIFFLVSGFFSMAQVNFGR